MPDERNKSAEPDNAHASATATVRPPVYWISIRQTFKKVAGIGFYIGWDKYPRTILIQFGIWTLAIGPHIYSSDKSA